MTRKSSVSRYVVGACLFVAISNRATLGEPLIDTPTGAVLPIPPDWGGVRIPDANDTYGVITGLWNTTGAHYVIENYPIPTHDDIVAFDGISEQINDYLPSAGSIRRFVNERIAFDSPLPGEATLVITVTGVRPDGGPGDLWPTNANGPYGDISLGITPLDVVYDPLTWDGLTNVPVVSGSIRWRSDGTFVTPRNLPISTFFDNGNWDGVLQIAVSGVTAPTVVTDAIEISIVTTKVPEIGFSMPLLIGSIAFVRRRAR